LSAPIRKAFSVIYIVDRLFGNVAAPARITGRIRGQDNTPRIGYAVEFYVGRRKVGSSESSSNGDFEMELPPPGRKSSKAPFASIRILNLNGDPLLRTAPTQFTSRVLDFQVKLGINLEGRRESDVYADNLRRLHEAYRKLEGRLDPSNKEAIIGLKGLVSLISGWTDDKKRIETAGAREVVQVPKHPKVEKHQHVSAWDEVVLKA
jgi:hypothetical protein